MKLANLKETIRKGSLKQRLMLIIIGVFMVTGVIMLASKFMGSEAQYSGGSKLTTVPKVQSVQGGEVSATYKKALENANDQRATSAISTGGSALATIINTGKTYDGVSGCSNCCASCEASIDSQLSNLLNDGSISPATQSTLKQLAGQNITPEQYAARLAQLVKEGKLSPAQARALLAGYKQQYDGNIADAGAGELDKLVKSGKLSLGAANDIVDLQKKNLTPSEYAAALQRLAKQGKISPDMASQLLADYKGKKQGQLQDAMSGEIGTLGALGKITPDMAKSVAALQGANVPVNDFANTLAGLVKQGKLSSEAAAALLAQYKKLHGYAAGDGDLSRYTQTPKLSKADGEALRALQAQMASLAVFSAKLQGLVGTHAISAEVARALFEKYTEEFNAKQTAISHLSGFVQDGQLQNSASVELQGLIKKNVSVQTYQASVNKLQSNDAVAASVSQSLLTDYQSVSQTAEAKDSLVEKYETEMKLPSAAAATLQQLQNRNVSAADYAKQLQAMLAAGLISPQLAQELLEAYRDKLKSSGVSLTSSAGIQSAVPTTTVFTGSDPTTAGAVGDMQQLQQTVAMQQANNRLSQQQAAASNAQKQAAAEQQQKIDALSQRMSMQAQQLIAGNWNTVTQSYVGGVDVDAVSGGGSGSTADGDVQSKVNSATSSSSAPLIKAGTVMFAVLDTEANSDYADSPIMATVVSGTYKGAKVMGTIKTEKDGTRVLLEFTMMNMDQWPATLKVDAYAIDPETARSAIATSVDNHYMLRYGGLFAASFMEGMGSAIESSGSEISTDDGVVTSSGASLTLAEEALVALGTVGENMSTQFQKLADTSPTVKVKAGVGIGLLFMDNVTDDPNATGNSGDAGASAGVAGAGAASAGAAAQR